MKDLELPELRGNNLSEHFSAIGGEKVTFVYLFYITTHIFKFKVAPYREFIEQIASWDLEHLSTIVDKLYKKKSFAYATGWTRYDFATGSIAKVPKRRNYFMRLNFQ